MRFDILRFDFGVGVVQPPLDFLNHPINEIQKILFFIESRPGLYLRSGSWRFRRFWLRG